MKSKNNKGKFKQFLLIFLFIILFVFGLFIMLYPTISNYIVSKNQNNEIIEYTKELNNSNKEEMNKQLNLAHEYNSKLNVNDIQEIFGSDSKKVSKEYLSLLNIKGDIMAYIEIPKINVKIPIYHGTSDNVLNKGIGHVAGSSLPVGGEKTHAVLAGHRGLPSSKLFTDLDMIELGDIFYIYVLDEKLVYEVDNISVVEPSQLDLLEIREDDNITLVTCTPYAVNTHRLLVRGKRTTEEEMPKEVIKVNKVISKDSKILLTSLIGIDCIEILIIFILIIDKRKKRKK